MFRSTSPLPALIAWCRAFRHGLDIGLSPVKVCKQQAKSGPAVFRPIAARLAERIAAGDSFSDGLKPDAWRFPRLFVELVAIGEQAGRLPVVFEELEKHYEKIQTARRQLLSALVYPAMVYVAAILIVTLLILVLGAMSNPITGKPIDPLGLGLVGTSGAIQFLAVMGGFTVLVVGSLLILQNHPTARAKVEAWAMRVPAVLPCVRAFALQRFAMAAHMTIEAGMKADRVLKSSFRATANECYLAEADRAAKAARGGDEIETALRNTAPGLFTDEFLDATAVGEQSGRLAEVMARQSVQYGDEAIRRLTWLAKIAGGVVYVGVGLLVIFCIIKMVMNVYLAPLNDALKLVE